MFEEANNKKMEAMTAYREKRYQDALNLYTQAIKNNPHSGILYASRAQVFLDMKKPNAAIRDCEIAIRIAPDSAKGYKIRGRARKSIGQYDTALRDIQTGQKLDWDEASHKLESELKPRVDIIVANKKRKDEVEKKRSDAQKRRAQKTSSSSRGTESKNPFGGMGGMGGMGGSFPNMGGMPGGMPGMGELPPELLQAFLSDPDLLLMMQDPSMLAKLQEIMADPTKVAQYQNDPKFAKLFSKISGMM